ncbi:MAG: hypothetical protein Q8N68_00775, partial [bacterium]|nr:hypothetical protein [bacterium]
MNSLLKNSKLLALIIFVYGFLQRLFLDLAFWEKYGAHASHLTEIWIYCQKASEPLPPHTRDLTIYLLRLIGKIFPFESLMPAVSIFGAILSSLTGVVIFYLVKNILLPNTAEKEGQDDFFIPLAAAFFYTGISSTQALSVVSFTHDLLQIPMILGFLALVVAFWKRFNHETRWRAGLRKNWHYLAATIVIGYLSFHINPVFLLTLPFAGAYSVLQIFYRQRRKVEKRNILFFYLSVLAILFLGRYVFYDQILSIIHHFLAKTHGIDLLYILGQNSKDLVPTDMDKKFLDLYVLCFFLPFGFYAAYKNKRIIAPAFFILSFFLATVMDRGSRLLNVGAAILASFAFWYRQKFYITDYIMTGILILAFLGNPGSSMLKSGDKFVFIVLPLILLWAYKKYFQKYGRGANSKIYTFALLVLLLAPSFLSLFLYKYWIKPSLTQGEYETATWLRANTSAGEKIFLNWGEAPYYHFLTLLAPVNRLAKTELDQDKIYWQKEDLAVLYAASRG